MKLATLVSLVLTSSTLLTAASALMSRDAFQKAVIGKTQQQTMKLVGKPQSTLTASCSHNDLQPCEMWTYIRKTSHPVTGQPDTMTVVHFGSNNQAVKIQFN